MSIVSRKIAEGAKFSVWEIVKDNKAYVSEFVSRLPREIRTRVAQDIRYIAENGPPRNESKFKCEQDGIFAIKRTRDQVRIYCFFDEGQVILLTNGALKKGRKADPEDLARAKRLRKAFLESKRSQ